MHPHRNAMPAPTMRRGADAPTVLALFLGLPKFLISLGLVIFVANLLDSPLNIAVIVVWLLSGGLVFVRPVENLLAVYLFRLRLPTAVEAPHLAAAWRDVTAAARIDPSRYTLWIENSDEPNAFAAAGHIVAVTRFALRSQDPAVLRGVLAHELGHHLKGHAWSSLVIGWYSWPAAIAMRLSWYASNVIYFILRFLGGAAFSSVFGFVLFGGILIAAILFGGMFMLAALGCWVIGQLLLMAESAAFRIGELNSDRVAVQLGYGPPLLHFLREALDEEGPREPLLRRLTASHPPVDKRVRALETRLMAIGQPVAPLPPRHHAVAPPPPPGGWTPGPQLAYPPHPGPQPPYPPQPGPATAPHGWR